jgi:septal ring factor EnvC (AmiA/AmiB activator)
VERVKEFLRNLRPNIEAADLEIQIRNQEETIAKAEKKLNGLKSDKAELEKKLATNIADQEATQKDIDNQRVTLEVLRGKRKKD